MQVTSHPKMSTRDIDADAIGYRTEVPADLRWRILDTRRAQVQDSDSTKASSLDESSRESRASTWLLHRPNPSQIYNPSTPAPWLLQIDPHGHINLSERAIKTTKVANTLTWTSPLANRAPPLGFYTSLRRSESIYVGALASRPDFLVQIDPHGRINLSERAIEITKVTTIELAIGPRFSLRSGHWLAEVKRMLYTKQSRIQDYKIPRFQDSSKGREGKTSPLANYAPPPAPEPETSQIYNPSTSAPAPWSSRPDFLVLVQPHLNLSAPSAKSPTAKCVNCRFEDTRADPRFAKRPSAKICGSDRRDRREDDDLRVLHIFLISLSNMCADICIISTTGSPAPRLVSTAEPHPVQSRSPATRFTRGFPRHIERPKIDLLPHKMPPPRNPEMQPTRERNGYELFTIYSRARALDIYYIYIHPLRGSGTRLASREYCASTPGMRGSISAICIRRAPWPLRDFRYALHRDVELPNANSNGSVPGSSKASPAAHTSPPRLVFTPPATPRVPVCPSRGLRASTFNMSYLESSHLILNIEAAPKYITVRDFREFSPPIFEWPFKSTLPGHSSHLISVGLL
ncbi:hypothetical protein FB451DRAFT_1196956 [Mycena latifolia]|nr:hypothetical protein FB451DRAFT_1196956 [Mycena latifolia]